MRTLPLQLCLAGLLPWSAHAAPEDTTGTIVPVVDIRGDAPLTTLSGPPTRSMDAPYSVSTVTTATLHDQGGSKLLDALRNVPGASADFSFSGSHTQAFALRGFVSDSGTGAGRVVRDGARLSNYPFVPAFTESVEVLRGPGALAATRSEPGGTVEIVTKQAEMDNFGSASATIGENGERELAIDSNRVLSADHQLAARVVLTHSEASEWRHVPDRLDGVKLALSQSGATHHIRLGYEDTSQRLRPDYGLPALNGRPAAVPADRQLSEPWDDSRLRNHIADLHGDLTLRDQTRLAIDATHLDAESTAVRQNIGLPVPGKTGYFTRNTSLEPGTVRNIDTLDLSLSKELEGAAVRHKLYAAIEYYKERLYQPSANIAAGGTPPIDIFNPRYGLVTPSAPGRIVITRERLESGTASIQDQMDWAGGWSAVIGAQYLRQHFFYGSSGTPVAEQHWSPKLALMRHLSPQQTLYASYSTGASPNQAASASGQSLPSRTSRQFELGAKSDWPLARLRTDAALFVLEQDHMLADDPATPDIYDKRVTGSGRSRGAELSAQGRVGPALSFVAAYAYTDARYRQGSEFNGNAIPNVARHTASLFAHYDWNDAWRGGLGIYAQGRRYANEGNTTILPGYARLDATQSWRGAAADGRLEVQLSVRNLLNRSYQEASHLHVDRYIVPGQSRALTASLTYRY